MNCIALMWHIVVQINWLINFQLFAAHISFIDATLVRHCTPSLISHPVLHEYCISYVNKQKPIRLKYKISSYYHAQ